MKSDFLYFCNSVCLRQEKCWEPFRICLLNSTANPAHFHKNWAELAVLFSRQILNGSQDFFLFNIFFFIYFFKYEIVETILCMTDFILFFLMADFILFFLQVWSQVMLHGKQNKQETKKLLQKLLLQKLPSHISNFRLLPETFQATYQQLSHKPFEKSDYIFSHCYTTRIKRCQQSPPSSMFSVLYFFIKWILEKVSYFNYPSTQLRVHNWSPNLSKMLTQ